MIPKIIHYIWFGDPSKRPMDRINRWKEVLTGWEFKEWNESNLDIDKYPYVKTAYDLQRYGICIDPFRPYLLYAYGGVWLDTDVNVYRDFSDLIDCNLLVGRHYRYGMGVSLGVLGAEPGNRVMKEHLAYYDERWTKSTTSAQEISASVFAATHGAYNAPEPIFLAIVRRLYGADMPRERDNTTADGVLRFELPEVLSIKMKSNPGSCYAEHLYEGSWCKAIRHIT